MDDFLRDFVITAGGPLPVIGGGIALCALVAWFAWKMKDDYKEVSIGLGIFAAIILMGAIGSYTDAQNSCKSLWTSGQNIKYVTSNCELITTCPVEGYCD